eukprot:1191731-Alexandrium_andersonii.AAC.1
MASFMLTCQQLSQTSRQVGEEELFIAGVEVDLNLFGKAFFNGCAAIFNRLCVDQSLALFNQPAQATKVTSRAKVHALYVRDALSILRQHSYFVDFQLTDSDNQKWLWQRSFSMEKDREYIPVFKGATSTDAKDNNAVPEEQSAEDF